MCGVLRTFAAKVHDDLGGFAILAPGRSGHPVHEFAGQLKSGQDLHSPGHGPEGRLPAGAALLRGATLSQADPRQRQHETWVDTVVAGRAAGAGPGARLGPARPGALRVAGAPEEVDDLAHD